MKAVSLLISLIKDSSRYVRRSFNAMSVNSTHQICGMVFTIDYYIQHEHAHACLPNISAVIAILRSVAPL